MVSALVDLLIFIAGMVVMGFLMLPDVMNSWEEGYEAAKERYDNWDLGFKEGFNAGVGYLIDSTEKEDAR
jgi:hypothetical protein